MTGVADNTGSGSGCGPASTLATASSCIPRMRLGCSRGAIRPVYKVGYWSTSRLCVRARRFAKRTSSWVAHLPAGLHERAANISGWCEREQEEPQGGPIRRWKVGLKSAVVRMMETLKTAEDRNRARV